MNVSHTAVSARLSSLGESVVVAFPTAIAHATRAVSQPFSCSDIFQTLRRGFYEEIDLNDALSSASDDQDPQCVLKINIKNDDFITKTTV